MAWIYLPELEESVLRSNRGCGRSATSKSTGTARPSSNQDSKPETWNPPRSGTILPPSTPDHGLGRWISSRAGSRDRARTSARRARERDWRASAAAFFSRSCGSQAWFDRSSSTWKTYQLSIFGEAEKWLEPLPRYGLMLDGVIYQLSMWERRTSGKDGGVWLTPRATDIGKGEGNETFIKRMGDRTDKCAQSLPAQVNNPKTWPTPRGTDGTHGGLVTPRKSKEGGNLIEAVSMNLWPTPAARDWRSGKASQETMERNARPLNEAVMWPTPRSNQAMAATITEKADPDRYPNLETVLKKRDPSVVGGSLNPTWVEWLMGYPSGWINLGLSETQWFLQRRGKRSKG